MPSNSALRDDASKGRTGMCPWWVKGCVLWEIWKPYVEEERVVSWLRTDPSDAVYVRGDARRMAAMADGSSGVGTGLVHVPQVQSCWLHAVCAVWGQGGWCMCGWHQVDRRSDISMWVVTWSPQSGKHPLSE